MTKPLVLSSLAVLGAMSAAPAMAQQTLNATGASFPAPLFELWFQELKQANGPVVTYTPVNSATGIRQLVELDVDFGATDRPLTRTTAAKVKRGLVQIPVVGGSVAVGYNKPGCDLKLSHKQLSGIFLGSINNWKELGCKEGPIKVVTRSDSSGTTLAFTKSLASWSPEFRTRVGEGLKVSWPVGSTSAGNEGISSTLQSTKGSIGYLNVPGIKGSLQAAELQNKAGNYMLPNSATGIAAMESIKEAGLTPEAISNPPGRDAYPIVAMSWLQAYETGNGMQAKAIRDTFRFMLSNPAQSQADNLGYVPLSKALQESAMTEVEKIRE